MNQNSIVVHWDTDQNFWVLNPGFKSVKLFKQLYDSDKSKGQARSSKIMWAVALYVDLHEGNVWRNLTDGDKKKLIIEDFLEDPKFDFDAPEIEALVEEYEFRILTIAQKELRRYEKKLSQRGDFMEKTDYTMDTYTEDGKIKKGTATQLDKMMVDSVKIFEQLNIIKGQLNKEEAEGNLKGGTKESASESGRI